MSFGIPPWELNRVALHYQEERRVILMAQYEAKMELAKQHKVTAEKIILPEF